MPPFKKLNTKIYQKSGPQITEDNIYWKKQGVPVLVKEFGPIDYIDFSPIEPHYFAVTCSVRVQVYNPINKLVVKNLSRFRENAYGAVFRSDGKLICAGGEESNVRLFDLSTKSLLRLFKGHSAPVHRTHFLHGRPQISSFSDDKTVRIWDIATEKTITTFSAHTDYVRSGATCLAMPDTLISGGYDNKVKMFDTRSKNEVLSVDHGSPIESLLFLPCGTIFLSAGGTEIKIWNVATGGKLVGSISQHHKTITCLRLASDNKRLLSGSLDRHVKIYDVTTFKTVHTLDFPNSILSLGVSKNDDTIVAGLVDGMVSVIRREEKDVRKPQKKLIDQYVCDTHPMSVDRIVTDPANEKETKYDHHLRKFEFAKALDRVLLPYVANKNPQVTVSVMQELINRKSLHKAYKGRDQKSLTRILRFLIRNISDRSFSLVLFQARDILYEVYGDSIITFPPEVRKLFVDLDQATKEFMEFLLEEQVFQGMINSRLAAQNTDVGTREFDKKGHNLTPSEAAQKNLVLNIE